MVHPDRWIVLSMKADSGELLYKVLAGFFGGYAYGDSWRLNSGIVGVSKTEDGFLDFLGYSGSIYRCHASNFGTNLAAAGVLKTLQDVFPGRVNVLASDTDWVELLNVQNT